MHVIRLGIVLVVLAVGVVGGGPTGAGENYNPCPPPLINEDLHPPAGGGGGASCACPSTGEHIGNMNADGTWDANPVDDGDCSTPYRPGASDETESPAVEVVAVASAVAAAAPPGQVLRRTG